MEGNTFNLMPQPGKTYDVRWSSPTLKVVINFRRYSLVERLKTAWFALLGHRITFNGLPVEQMVAKGASFSLEEVDTKPQ